MSTSSMTTFRDLCTKFESTVREKYQLDETQSPYFFISNREEYRAYKADINVIRTIRNTISHRDIKFQEGYGIEISQIACQSLIRLIDAIENPPLVKERYIKNMYYASLSSSVKEVIEYMGKNKISHVPILDERKKLLGVFSENTIFSKLSDEEIIGVDENEKISDYLKYIDIHNHSCEYFDFISINEKLFDAKEYFNNSIKNDKRLALLFVTKNGKDNQEILGLLTPWDLL